LAAWWLKHWWLAIPLVLGAIALAEIVVDFVLKRLSKPPLGKKVSKRILAAVSVGMVALSYFTVVALTAIAFRLFGRRLLPDFRKKNPSSYWTEREKAKPTLDSLKRQF